MNKHATFHMNIGLPSMLLVFVVLCLVSFSVLSLVSANADKKLSQKVMDRNSAYYEACNEAEQMLCEMDSMLWQIYTTAKDETDFYQRAAACQLTYMYPVSELQSLQVTIRPHYPSPETDTLYQIMQWQIITTGTLEYDESLHVIPDF